jgi:hypothetical protein
MPMHDPDDNNKNSVCYFVRPALGCFTLVSLNRHVRPGRPCRTRAPFTPPLHRDGTGLITGSARAAAAGLLLDLRGGRGVQQRQRLRGWAPMWAIDAPADAPPARAARLARRRDPFFYTPPSSLRAASHSSVRARRATNPAPAAPAQAGKRGRAQRQPVGPSGNLLVGERRLVCTTAARLQPSKGQQGRPSPARRIRATPEHRPGRNRRR